MSSCSYVRSLRMTCSRLWRLRFMEFFLAYSVLLASSSTDWLFLAYIIKYFSCPLCDQLWSPLVEQSAKLAEFSAIVIIWLDPRQAKSDNISALTEQHAKDLWHFKQCLLFKTVSYMIVIGYFSMCLASDKCPVPQLFNLISSITRIMTSASDKSQLSNWLLLQWEIHCLNSLLVPAVVQRASNIGIVPSIW